MYVAPLERLIEEFERMPGIGHKTAGRLAFYMLSLPLEETERFVRSVTEAKTLITLCSCCQNLTDANPCAICSDTRRDHSTICVVENPRDVIAMEKTHEFSGVYHVLHGSMSPMDNIGPDDLKMKELLVRLAGDNTDEVIMATNPTVTGEATAGYLAKLIKPFGIKVTRIAHGLPVGGDLEYADEITITRALEGRREM